MCLPVSFPLFIRRANSWPEFIFLSVFTLGFKFPLVGCRETQSVWHFMLAFVKIKFSVSLKKRSKIKINVNQLDRPRLWARGGCARVLVYF